MFVRRAQIAAPLVSLMLLSACSDDPVPKMPEPTSSSPSPTEDSSTVAPESPEQFIRRWQAAVDDMQASGETETFRALNRACVPCDDFAGQVEKTYADGGAIESRGSVVKEVVQASADADTFDATIKTSRTRIVGPKPMSYPGGVQVFRIRLSNSDDGFAVTDYRVLAQ